MTPLTRWMDFIIFVLLWHVRVATTRQLVTLAVHGGMHSSSAIRRALRQTEGEGLLGSGTTAVKLVTLGDEPLHRFHPEHETPGREEAERLSYRLVKRWNDAPAESTQVWFAGKRSIALFGGATKADVVPGSVSHDVLVTELYIRLLTTNPELASTWVGEDASPIPAKRGRKVPDAILHASTGEPVIAQEIGGMYPPDRLLGLWRDCARRNLALEIW